MDELRKLSLAKVLKGIKENSLTAYEIAKETPLTEYGVQKIINGTTKSPKQETLDIILDFLNNENRKDYQTVTQLKKNTKDIKDDFQGKPIEEKLNSIFEKLDEITSILSSHKETMGKLEEKADFNNLFAAVGFHTLFAHLGIDEQDLEKIEEKANHSN